MYMEQKLFASMQFPLINLGLKQTLFWLLYLLFSLEKRFHMYQFHTKVGPSVCVSRFL